MRLEQELGCFGLLGFGSGVVWGRANIKPDEKLNGADGYCAKGCEVAARCLLAHRQKVQLLYPRATRHFDGLMKNIGQANAMRAWSKAHPQTPHEPYLLQIIMNIEDGVAVAQTGRPRERGRHTLGWPRPQTKLIRPCK